MKKALYKTLDIVLLPFVYFSAWLLKAVRKKGVHRLPNIKRALFQVGVFPIRNHYYEPQFDFREPHKDFSLDRNLPGVNLNVDMQLANLKEYDHSNELENISLEKKHDLEFYLNKMMRNQKIKLNIIEQNRFLIQYLKIALTLIN